MRSYLLKNNFLGCNRNYTEPQGRLKLHGIKENCEINIFAPKNYTINLYFIFMNFYNSQCSDPKFEVIKIK